MYKKDRFNFPKDLSPQEFNQMFNEILMRDCDLGLMMTSKEGEAYGIVLGKNCGPFMLLGDVAWLPSTSSRNIIESMVNVFNELKKEMKFILYSETKYNDFYVHVAKHGLLRRVGHLNEIYKDKAILWESR